MNKDVIEKLKQADWHKITLVLTKYASAILRGVDVRHGSPLEGTIRNHIVKDVVMDAIEKVWDGRRAWNPDSGLDLIKLLKGVVRSNISRLYDTKEYESTSRIPAKQKAHNEDSTPVNINLSVAPTHEKHNQLEVARSFTPEQLLIIKQEKEREELFIDKLIQKLDGEGDLEEMFLHIMEGARKPKEIAALMETSAKDIYNMQKRLRRKFRNLQANNSNDDE